MRARLQRSVQSGETQQTPDLREWTDTRDSRWSVVVQIKHVTQLRHAGQSGAPRRGGRSMIGSVMSLECGEKLSRGISQQLKQRPLCLPTETLAS